MRVVQQGGVYAWWVVCAGRVAPAAWGDLGSVGGLCSAGGLRSAGGGGGGDLGGVVGLTDWWSVCGVQAEVRLTTGTKLCSCPLVTLWHVP